MKRNPQLVGDVVNFLNGLRRGLARAPKQRSEPGPTPTLTPKPKSGSPSASKKTSGRAGPSPNGATSATEFDTSHGLPAFDYAPRMDGDPDPGEIVWTWVPYEEDPEVGKDRPVLVVAHMGSDVAAVQMTSMDHDRDAAQEASRGRYWFEIGSGSWDAKGRVSEVRLDRILRVPPVAMRREGGILDEAMFREVVKAIERVHAQR